MSALEGLAACGECGALEGAPCETVAAFEVWTMPGFGASSRPASTHPVRMACTWCGADPGHPCTTIAAHPTTGRGIPWTLDYVHDERTALAAALDAARRLEAV